MTGEKEAVRPSEQSRADRGKYNLRGAALLPALVVLFLAHAPFAPAQKEEAGEWKPLFDGKSLDGWHALPGGEWKVEDGAIRGRSPRTERRHGLLVTDERYEDFVVRAKFRVHAGNSGFYFRIDEKKNAVGCAGFQAEVDRTMATGGLYETGGRAWVAKPDPETMKKTYRPGEWTDIEVSAIGKEVIVKINGVVTAHLKDDPGRTAGHIALQLHGGQDMDVEFKDLRIRVIGGKEGG